MRNYFSMASACLFFAGIASSQPVTVTYGYSGLPQPIFGDAANIITTVNLFVPQGIKMTTVTARIKIEYPQTGDLKVYLFSPAGTRTILLENDCGALVNVDTTFADAATAPWKTFCPVEAGRGPFQPDQPMSNFNNDDSAFGTWRLAVQNDQSDSRTGWIRDFSLTITGTAQTGIIRSETVTNAANPFLTGVISPGEKVSIFGIGVGPVNAVTAPAGALPTTLGGSTVTINGAAVPISYASMYRLDIQAPFSVAPGSQADVQASLNGTPTGSVKVNVNAVSPAIFTHLPGGTGSITAVNQDGTINADVRPAPKSSVVAFYASGLGAVNPSLTEGAVPPNTPLSNTVLPVTSVIDGISAPVQFAGAAPGFPGLYQVNVQIPANIPTGAHELRIYINGVSSQAGTTIAVQ